MIEVHRETDRRLRGEIELAPRWSHWFGAIRQPRANLAVHRPSFVPEKVPTHHDGQPKEARISTGILADPTEIGFNADTEIINGKPLDATAQKCHLLVAQVTADHAPDEPTAASRGPVDDR